MRLNLKSKRKPPKRIILRPHTWQQFATDSRIAKALLEAVGWQHVVIRKGGSHLGK